MNTNLTRRGLLAAASAGAASLALPALAQQGAYPDHAIRLIVPFPTGGGTDISARSIGAQLQAELGQPLVIDNRGGASGTIGTLAAMRLPPDGYNLLFTTSTNQVIAPLLLDKPPYDGARDFTPITLLISYLGVLLINASLPVNSFKEFVAYAKERPGKLNYGSSGIGSTNHLLGEMLKSRAGIDLTHVPYKGSAQAVQGLASGEIQVFLDTVPDAQIWLKQGKVKVIATSSEKRSSLMPDVPTLVELGVFDASTDFWMGLMAPPGTPAPIVKRLRAAAVKAMASIEMKQFATTMGGVPSTNTPAEFGKMLVAEQARWSEVIQRNHIRAE